MTISINKKTFSGTSKVFDGTLAEIIMSLAQNQAIVAASSVTDITDNGGGTAQGEIKAPVAVANYKLDNNDGAGKTALENAFKTVVDALSEIIAQLDNVRAQVPAFGELTDNTGGATPDGTVGAITKNLTGTGSSLASAVGVRAVYSVLMDRIYQATHFVNLAAKAVGVETVGFEGVVIPNYSTTFDAISTDTGTAVDGSDETDEKACVEVGNANAMMTQLANAIKDLTSALNKITSGSPTITVVAS